MSDICAAPSRPYDYALIDASDLQQSLIQPRESVERLIHHQQLHTLGELSAGIAHDLNNMLMCIMGNIHLMLRETDATALHHGLQVIERAANDGAVIVQRLQNFTRPATNREAVPIDLGMLVEGALELTRPRWHPLAKSLTNRIDIVTKLRSIITAPVAEAEVRQILINIFLNALDAMPKGGTLYLETTVQANNACILVRDTGTGIPPELLPRIFDPFVTTKGTRGNGMGLAVSALLIAQQGGHISVESTSGIGSLFTIHLPLAASPVAPALAPTLLIVDDEDEVRQLLGRAMQKRGWQVSLAASAEEAFRMLIDQPYDLVLTDLLLPGMSGYELICMLRRHNSCIGTILMSGLGQIPVDPNVPEPEIDHILIKPFTLDVLNQYATTILQRVQQRSTLPHNQPRRDEDPQVQETI